MSFHRWLQNLRSVLGLGRGQGKHGRRGSRGAVTHRPNLEVLEDRLTPSFSPAVSYPVGGWSTSPFVQNQPIVTADFNHDAVLDLAVGNYNGGGRISVLLGNGDGSFQPALDSVTGGVPVSLAVGDFDRDGNVDLATAGGFDGTVLLGNGDGTFRYIGDLGFGDGNYPQAVAVGDFNRDGKLDLGVTSNAYHDYYSDQGFANVLLGHGDGSFSAPNVTALGVGHFYSAVAADFNHDGFDDFATVRTGWSSMVAVLMGQSSGYLQAASGYATGDYSVSVAAGDLNADGNTDLVTANAYGSNVGVLLGAGAGTFSAGGNHATDRSPAAIAFGDFTGDGKVDVATANSSSNDLTVLPGRGDGTLAPWVSFPVGATPNGVAAGDFNRDGWLDVATSNNDASDVSVLINDQSWPPPPLPSIRIGDGTVTEGNTGATSATFTLSLSAAYNQNVTVHYRTADGSATAGSDYTAASGDVIIPAGQLSRTFAVEVRGDRLPEPNETFLVNLSSPTNATIANGQGVGTILDDEPRISISDVTKKEGNGKKTTLFTFTVTLSAAYDQAVTLSYRTVDGTAMTSDQDYVAQTGTLTFKPGETSKTITIDVKGDSKSEANETFYLDLFGLSSNALFTKNRGTGTILNDD